MNRLLVVLGVLLVAAGLAWPWLSKLPLGRLPGDIRIESEHGGFYFPITTCIIVSLVISLILWFLRR
jgi:ribose/xylose/arabinose/galactoside ABC-type transport system permease subunit